MAIAAEIVKNAVLGVPGVGALRDRLRVSAGYDSTKDDALYVEGVYAQHRAAWTTATGRNEPPGAVLEFGPGGNTDVADLFLRNGSRTATCIDVVPWAKTAESSVTYICPGNIETFAMPTGSFDFIYSHAVLEHVADPAAAIANIARLLRPGGVTSHQIDLRDHRDFSDPLRFLTHSEPVWRMATSRRLSQTNRWRKSDFLEAFAANGLDVEVVRDTDRAEVTERDRARMHARFRSKDLDDLAVSSVFIAATSGLSRHAT